MAYQAAGLAKAIVALSSSILLVACQHSNIGSNAKSYSSSQWTQEWRASAEFATLNDQELQSAVRAGQQLAMLEQAFRIEIDGSPNIGAGALQAYREVAGSGGKQTNFVPSSNGSVQAVTVSTGASSPAAEVAQARIDNLSGTFFASRTEGASHRMGFFEELLKADVFAGECINSISQRELDDASQRMSREQLAIYELHPGKARFVRYLAGQKCMAAKRLPEDCRSVWFSVQKALVYSAAVEARSADNDFLNLYLCTFGPDGEASARGDAFRKSPLDFALKALGAIAPMNSHHGRHWNAAQDTARENPAASQYFAWKCEYASLFGSGPLAESDFVESVCSKTGLSGADSRQAKLGYLSDWEVVYVN